MVQYKSIGYLRVSTDRQNVGKFRTTVKTYAKQKELENLSFVEEVRSGKIDFKDRLLFNVLNDKSVKNLIVPELSRIGRTARQILEVIDLCKDNNIIIFVIKENFIIAPNKQDINSIVMIHTFSMMAEIERELISERTKESLKALKEKGVKLGRKKGQKVGSKLDKDKNDILYLINQKVSKAEIARRYNITRQTLYNWLETLPNKDEQLIIKV